MYCKQLQTFKAHLIMSNMQLNSFCSSVWLSCRNSWLTPEFLHHFALWWKIRSRPWQTSSVCRRSERLQLLGHDDKFQSTSWIAVRRGEKVSCGWFDARSVTNEAESGDKRPACENRAASFLSRFFLLSPLTLPINYSWWFSTHKNRSKHHSSKCAAHFCFCRNVLKTGL